ncbi:MAG: hypothetical protein HY057_00005, partial [Rhodospirillales bacterium]|nr:hypothetical protein [Rhodospirillales bacterium]
TILTIAISTDYVRKFPLFQGEYYVLVLFSALGMLLMASANDLLTMFITLEFSTFGFYVLVAYQRDDPASSEAVSLRKGPFGLYMQLGEAAEGVKPKRVSLPRDLSAQTVDLDTALKLLALPREIGVHPETGHMVYAGLGRFGPYIKHDNKYRSLESTADLLSVGLNRAVDLLAQPTRGRRGAPATPLRELGPHPEDGKPIGAGVGRYGPFVKHGSTYANLPKGKAVEEVTLDEAIALIDERRARGDGKKGGKKKRAAKPAATEATPEKSAAPKVKRKTAAKGKVKAKSKTAEPAPAEDDAA